MISFFFVCNVSFIETTEPAMFRLFTMNKNQNKRTFGYISFIPYDHVLDRGQPRNHKLHIKNKERGSDSIIFTSSQNQYPDSSEFTGEMMLWTCVYF